MSRHSRRPSARLCVALLISIVVYTASAVLPVSHRSEAHAQTTTTQRIGPVGEGRWGGSTPFEDIVPAGARITSLVLWGDTLVNGVQLLTTAGPLPLRGTATGQRSELVIGEGDRIITIIGGAGWYVDRIAAFTVRGASVTAGGTGGDAYGLDVPFGARLVGLFGSAGDVVDSLGLVTAIPPTAGEGLAGDSRPFELEPTGGIATVRVWAGTYVSALEVIGIDGVAQRTTGRPLGQPDAVVTFAPGEHLVGVFGGAGWYIDRIGFITSTGRRIGPFGGPGGAPYELIAKNGLAATGFYGQSGLLASTPQLDRIGLVTSPAASAPNLGPASLGRWGGSTAFDDTAAPGGAITGLDIWVGTFVEGIQLRTTAGPLPRRGTDTGTRFSITLEPGEGISTISGGAGWYVDWLTVRTTTGRILGPYGGRGGATFTLRGPTGTSVVGLFGSAGTIVDSLGIRVA